MAGHDAALERYLQRVVQGEYIGQSSVDEAIALLQPTLPPFPNTPDDLQQRLQWLRELYPRVQAVCCGDLGWQAVPLLTLWSLWLPLTQQIIGLREKLHRPMIQGFLGSQGTGKTTLTRILTSLLEGKGYRTASLSLDDLYKTFADRQELQRQDSRLLWRGPPGTHDVGVGLDVLRRVQMGTNEPIWMPRFDKSLHGGMGDRISPIAISGIDVLLFEGWFVGIRPIDPALFETAPPPIVTKGDRTFVRDCNTRLQEYVPLWELLDSLIVLNPVDYRLSKAWRQQAEQEMMQQGRSGLSNSEIEQFVEYFWKALPPELFWPPLLQNPQWVDWIVDIQADHTPGDVYRGGNPQFP